MADLIPRPNYLAKLHAIEDRDLVRIVTGVRRCGKSALLSLYRQDLLNSGVPAEDILVINFEDARNDRLREPQAFHTFVEEALDQGLRYLHVDEVQELEDWARIINSLRLNDDLEITLTGSNASMFAGESLTYLAGRYIELRMLPLSLSEFAAFAHREKSSPTIPTAEDFSAWMRIGGFPASVLANDVGVASDFNRALFDSIFTRDIALRGQIRDTSTFLRLAQFIFDNSGSELSTRRIRGVLKADGYASSSETIDRYLELMEDAHLLYRCRSRDTKGKQWLRSNGKYYFVDPGLRNAVLGSRDFNLGHDLENMVFLELLRRDYEVSTGSVPDGEIDFIATRGDDTFYVQVAYATSEPSTLERELAPFAHTPAGSRCILITLDRFPPPTGHVQWVDGLAFLAGQDLAP